MKILLPLCLAAVISSCASTSPTVAQADVNGGGVISPTEDSQYKQPTPTPSGLGGTGTVTNTIRNTASTVGIIRNLQTIFRGF